MRKTTTSEFFEWKVLIEEEWTAPSKQDYYLAQIAMEVRRFQQIFLKDPKPISLEECLLPVDKEKEDQPVRSSRRRRKRKGPKRRPISTAGRKTIEVGVDPLDEKWQQVNENAKAIWRDRLTPKTSNTGE